MNLQFLDYIQRRLYQIDKTIQRIRGSIDIPGSEYDDLRCGYRLACDDINKLEKEAKGLIKRLRSNI